MAANLAVVGAQWGDEGKGKVVDLLSDRFDVVARYQGGPNAGHTVTIGGRRHALQHIPSGVFRPETRIVIGNGTVLDLAKLIGEIDNLAAGGVVLDGRLFISDRAHVILPLLARIDAVRELAAGDAAKIGTTQRGIGPTYEAKAARIGLRVGDLADRAGLVEKIRRIVDGEPGRRIREGGEDPGQPEAIAAEAYAHGQRLAPFIADATLLLNDWMDDGRSILFEGAQGTLLDLDHGSYPFVTSSSTVAGGLCGGLGVSPRRVDAIAGVFKAYCSRVGSGPMPTELLDGPDGLGEKLRQRGREFGTVTGRPRRCGCFDEIPVCVGYRLDGREIRSFPPCVSDAQRVQPVYETLPGWKKDTTGARRWNDLPEAARGYLARLGAIIGSEVALVSVGPDREQSIVKPGGVIARRLAER